MKAIHGGKAKTDEIDAHNVLPFAFVADDHPRLFTSANAIHGKTGQHARQNKSMQPSRNRFSPKSIRELRAGTDAR
jgi:hypothetical protein